MNGLPGNLREIAERFLPNGDDSFVAPGGFRSTFEQDGVSRLERQGSDLRNSVGASFENDGEDAKRAGFLLENQAIVEFGGREALTERIGKVGDLADPSGHFGDAVFLDSQACEKCWR